MFKSVKVSSVLQNDHKTFGKSFLLDGREDTCWSSGEGSPQSILATLVTPSTINQISIMFQGGFAGKLCKLYGRIDSGEWNCLSVFRCADCNLMQRFNVEKKMVVDEIRIVFEESFDFYGRITVYLLECA